MSFDWSTLLLNGSWTLMLTLIHMTWIGLLVGAVAFVGNLMLARSSAQKRYLLNLGALLLFGLTLPVGIAFVALRAQSDPKLVASQSMINEELIAGSSDASPMEPIRNSNQLDGPLITSPAPENPEVLNRAEVATFEAEDASSHSMIVGADSNLVSEHGDTTSTLAMQRDRTQTRIAIAVTAIYLVGVVCMFIKLLIGIYGGQRLRSSCQEVLDPTMLKLARLQMERMKLRTLPVLKYCHRVSVPVVVGVIRPTVLLPAQLMTGLNVGELSEILAHEFAHIRRSDHVWVCVQRVAESLLFFHPITWYLSRRITLEREVCCDELVVANGHDRVAYATALLRVAELQQKPTPSMQAATQVAMDGQSPSKLRERIMNILNERQSRRFLFSRTDFAVGSLTLAIATTAMMSLLLVLNNQSIAASPQEDESVETNEPTSDEPITFAKLPGSWQISEDRRFVIREVGGEEDSNEKQTIGTIQWDENSDVPRIQYEFFIARDSDSGEEPWVVAWEPNTAVLWILSMTPEDSKPFLRRIDFSKPDAIHVHTELGEGGENEEVDSPEPADWVAAVHRRHFSIGSPMPRMPDEVEAKFKESIEGYKGTWRGPYSPLSGNYEASATPEAEWIIEGRVVDISGNPLPDATVFARLELYPTIIVDSDSTDQDGRYTLRFRTDLDVLKTFRGVMVTPKVRGYRDVDLSQSGEFTLALDTEEEVDTRFSSKKLVLGEAGEAEFVMREASSVEGTVVDDDDKPIANAYVYVRSPSQRKGYTLASANTDENGRYAITDVPSRTPLQIGVALRPLQEGTVEIEQLMKNTALDLDLKLRERNGFWSLHIRKQDARTERGDNVGPNNSATQDPSGESNDAISNVDENDVDDEADDEEDRKARIERILDKKVSLTVERTPIIVFLDELSQDNGFEVTIELSGLKERGVTANHPINFEARDTTIREVLDEVLSKLQLDYEVIESGIRVPKSKEDLPMDTDEDSERAHWSMVVDRQGNPIAGAKVELRPYTIEEQPAFASTETNDRGIFEYPEATPDSEYFRLYISADGFVANRWIGNYKIFVKKNGERVPDVLVLDREVTLRGRVVGANGEAIPGVPLAFDYFNERIASINNRRFESDENGEFELSGVSPGELFIRFEEPSESIEGVPDGARFYVAHVHVDEPTSEVNDVVIDLSRAQCTLEGQLVDDDGMGVAEAEIRIAYAFSAHRLDHTVRTTTDENGRFRINGLPPHAFEVAASKRGRGGLGPRVTVQLRPNETTSIRMLPFIEGFAPPADREEELNWGPEFDSLQAALVFDKPTDSYSVGDVVNVGAVIRNVGEETVEFTDTWSFNRLHIRGADGFYRSLDYRYFTGLPWDESYQLKPGHEVKLRGSFNIQFRGEGDSGGGNAMFKAALAPDKEYRFYISFGDGFDNYPDDGSPEREGRRPSGEMTIRIDKSEDQP